MNITEIYTSRKLEKIVPEALLRNESLGNLSPLGKWNATVFHVSHKKCLLLTNAITRYSVFLPGIRNSDFKNIAEIFVNTLSKQLKRDRVETCGLDIADLIGETTLHPTDNNRAIIGTQKYLLENVDYWKSQYGRFENWDFEDINRRVNGIPYRQLDWLVPREKMTVLLEEIVNL